MTATFEGYCGLWKLEGRSGRQQDNRDALHIFENWRFCEHLGIWRLRRLAEYYLAQLDYSMRK
jgi:hypothetical protein